MLQPADTPITIKLARFLRHSVYNYNVGARAARLVPEGAHDGPEIIVGKDDVKLVILIYKI